MIDDVHHLIRMHRHDDLRWRLRSDESIELVPYFDDRRPDERLDELCRGLGFEPIGNGAWCVRASSPHYLDLWIFVEQDRLDSED
jgi:hypothetical protein